VSAAIISIPLSIGYGIIVYGPLGSEFLPFAALLGIFSCLLGSICASLLGGTQIQITAPKAPLSLILAAFVLPLTMSLHVPDPASVIQACADLVKPGGDVFFSTINRNPKSYLFAIIGAEYVLRMLPKGTHEFRKFIRPSELDSWARSVGLEVQDLTGMTYNPLTQVYRLGRDVDVNYLAWFKKPL